MLYRRYSRSSPDPEAALAAPVTVPYLNRTQRQRLTQDLAFQARTGFRSPGESSTMRSAHRTTPVLRFPQAFPHAANGPGTSEAADPTAPRRPQRVHARTASSPAGRKKRAATTRVLASLLPLRAS